MRLIQLQERNMAQNRKNQSSLDLTWGFEFEIACDLDEVDDDDDLYEHFYDIYIRGQKDKFKKMYAEYSDTPLISKSISYMIPWDNGEHNMLNWGFYDVNEYYNLKEIIDDLFYEQLSLFKNKHNLQTYFTNKLEELELPKQNEWQIVTDDSINPQGREIVTPVLNYNEAKVALEQIFSMIQDDDNLSTNSTTGLHLNVGTFEFDKIDLLKFLVFFDDVFVVKLFNRESNGYAKIISNKISDLDGYLNGQNKNDEITKDNSFTNQWVLDNMGKKYQAVNFRKFKDLGYLEIRAPGGIGYEEKLDVVLKLMERVQRALTVAIDPNAYRSEYLKKISKYIDKENNEEVVSFTNIINEMKNNPYINKITNLYYILLNIKNELDYSKLDKNFIFDFKKFIIKNKNDLVGFTAINQSKYFDENPQIKKIKDEILNFIEKNNIIIKESTTASSVASSAIPFGSNTNPYPENSIYKRPKFKKNIK
jgi:hypothetical protein